MMTRFTGHIGCGKSTELQRLKAELEEQGFRLVYFESSQVMDMADVDITDILLAIARQVSESLEAIQIELQRDLRKAARCRVCKSLRHGYAKAQRNAPPPPSTV
jgi:thymidylate kinase